MIKKSVQLLMLSKASKSDEKVLDALMRVKAAGFDSIELNSFMVHPSSFMVRALTKAAGMGVGSSGKRDWKGLIEKSGLSVTSLHSDLGSLERNMDGIVEEATKFGTKRIVITGMYRYDYTSSSSVSSLATRLNKCGENLRKSGMELFYHNHNIELTLDEKRRRALDVLLLETDKENLSFELDTYWLGEAGADPKEWMKKMGERMKLWHIADRGWRSKKDQITPIVECDSVELGTGNMPLEELLDIAKVNRVEEIVLETHKNWINNDPVASLEISGKWLKERV